MRCSLEGDLQFEIFSNKGKQLKYIRKGSNHKTGTLRAISSVLLNFLEKFTVNKPDFNSKRVDCIYPNNDNTLHEEYWNNFGKIRMKNGL